MSQTKMGLRRLLTDEPDHRPGRLRFRHIGNPQFRHRSLFPVSEYLAQCGQHLIFFEVAGHTENHPIGMNRIAMEGNQIIPRHPCDRIQRAFSSTGMIGPIEDLGKFSTDDGPRMILPSANPFDRLQLGELHASRVKRRPSQETGQDFQPTRDIFAQHIQRRRP